MIVTIDGPAGAGKSSIARQVAERLGFEFLDTGAMYRAVTLGAIRAQIDLQDVDALVEFAENVQLRWDDCRIYLDGDDVTDEIRSPVVTDAIRHVADLPAVRRQLSMQQRRIAEGRDIVTEGRDQGSEVFPDAAVQDFFDGFPRRTRPPPSAAACRRRTVLAAGRFSKRRIDGMRKTRIARSVHFAPPTMRSSSRATECLPTKCCSGRWKSSNRQLIEANQGLLVARPSSSALSLSAADRLQVLTDRLVDAMDQPANGVLDSR